MKFPAVILLECVVCSLLGCRKLLYHAVVSTVPHITVVTVFLLGGYFYDTLYSTVIATVHVPVDFVSFASNTPAGPRQHSLFGDFS